MTDLYRELYLDKSNQLLNALIKAIDLQKQLENERKLMSKNMELILKIVGVPEINCRCANCARVFNVSKFQEDCPTCNHHHTLEELHYGIRKCYPKAFGYDYSGKIEDELKAKETSEALNAAEQSVQPTVLTHCPNDGNLLLMGFCDQCKSQYPHSG